MSKLPWAVSPGKGWMVWFILASVTVFPWPALAERVVHHVLDVRLDPERARIEAEDVITFPGAGGETRSLTFTLNPALKLEAGAAKLTSLAPGQYRVVLSGAERELRLAWYGELPSTPRCDWLVEACRKLDPQGAYLDAASAWYPVIADTRVTFELRVRMPRGWRSLTQGQLDRPSPEADAQREIWRIAEPQEDIYFFAGPFHVYERPGRQAVLRVYLRSADPALAERYLEASERYLERYSALIGPYPYAQFAVAESFWETGWGMPSFTLLGPRVLRLPFILDSSLPHEILHNWWGNAVYIDTRRGNWAEGLTAYLADYAIQEEKGQGAAYRRAALQKYADYVTREQDFPVREFRARHGEVSQAVGYSKVLMVLHMLRGEIGDAAFFGALRRFYSDFRFRAASFDDLRGAFERASGRDLGGFFAQWLDRPGAPELRLGPVALDDRGGGGYRLRFTLGQGGSGAPFALTIPYRVEGRSGQVVARGVLALSGAEQSFTLNVADRPAALFIDPDFDVFRRLDPSELPPSLGQLFGARRMVVVLPENATRAQRDAYARALAAWRERFPEIEVASDADPLPDASAVWVWGWENRHARAVLDAAPEVRASAHEVTVGGRSFQKSASTLVITGRSPAGRPLGLIAGHDAVLLPALAPRLTHYGKYGYLVFDAAGDNVHKGEWAVRDSALVWRAPDGDSHGLAK